MFCESIKDDLCRLTLPEAEGAFFINVLARLGRQYQENLAQLPPTVRRYWEGRITVNDSLVDELQEAQEVLQEERAQLRNDRLALIENWLSEFDLAESRDPWTVELTLAERDDLIAMLNDRRLLLALEFGITDTDMEVDPIHLASEARRQSILEIDVLGHFILVLLGP